MTKNIRKSFKYSVYVMLTACTVIFGSSSEARASDIFEEGAKYFERNIARPTRYRIEDARTTFDRSTRPRSNNPLENAWQGISDWLEDAQKAIERKVITPTKDLLEDSKLL